MVARIDPQPAQLNRNQRITRLKPRLGVPDSQVVSASHFILMVEDGQPSSDALAANLVRLGVEPIRVDSLSEATEIVNSNAYSIGGVLISSQLPGTAIKNAMREMRRRGPLLQAMAYGKPPDENQRIDMQKAGVLLALWDGYDDGILRFQLNRLLARDNDLVIRGSQRAPTHTPIRILVGGREKDGVLYSISEGGCFIVSPRASMEGAYLQLVFRLGEVDFSLDGTVAFSNVPGNLQRPNLPLGMGVRFARMPGEARWQIADFIRERMEALEV